MEDHNKVETNYDDNKDNPGPSKEAVEEKNDEPAGRLIHWVTIAAVVILVIVFIVYYL